MAFAAIVALNCSTAFAWYAPGQGWIESVWPPPSPKIPAEPITHFEEIPVNCYDAFTMVPLNCPFSVSISEDTSPLFIFDGGHTHSRMAGTGIGKLSGAGAVQVSQWEVWGQTAQTSWIKHDRPEMSGGVVMKGVVPAPPGYVCPPDGSLAACTVFYHYGFQVQGLRLMPPSTANDYTFTGHPFLADGVTPNNHTGNHYGTPRLVAAIQEVARNFKIRSQGRVLGVNDMSLPWGGLYDYKSTGTNPHTYHRKGESVDIDSKAVRENQDMNLAPDPYFQKILTEVFKDQGCKKKKEGPIHYDCK